MLNRAVSPVHRSAVFLGRVQVRALVLELGNIGARDERFLARALQDDNPNVVVGIERFYGVAELIPHRFGDGVMLWPHCRKSRFLHSRLSRLSLYLQPFLDLTFD